MTHPEPDPLAGAMKATLLAMPFAGWGGLAVGTLLPLTTGRTLLEEGRRVASPFHPTDLIRPASPDQAA